MAPMPTLAAFDGPVLVVGPQFCAPHVVDLTVTKKALSLTGNDFTVTDVNANVVLKTKGVFFSLRNRRVLLDAAGNPLLTLQQKILTLHGRCRVFRGESTDSKDLLFSVKMSSMLQFFKTKLHVIMASNTNEDACDFKIKGRYFRRSCTVHRGESNSIVAEMRRKITVKNLLLGKDTFSVTVYPNVDYAFVASLIVIFDKINKDRSRRQKPHKVASLGMLS